MKVKFMIKKLNKLLYYQSNGYKPDSDIYYLYSGSERSSCHKCKYYLTCPYSYRRVYYDNEGHCIKCFRFIPIDESFDRNVGLYSTDKNHYEYFHFRAGKIL